jgi:oxygen-independent coproporphyrinogen-3 oxidase
MDFADELARRLSRPQRHRLLQGFPAVPAMERAIPSAPRRDLTCSLDGSIKDTTFAEAVTKLRKPAGPPGWLDFERRVVEGGDHSRPPLVTLDPRRSLIVGIIPHTQCTPAREGCGFCTFPHDRPDTRMRAQTVETVMRDIDTVCGDDRLQRRRVEAVYFGGGTATLSSPHELQQLMTSLHQSFDLRDAELSLEGTANGFDRFFSSHLDWLMKQRVGTRRISMGLQTFDARFLALMGRQKFGSASTVRALERKCRGLGIATSGDLLFNLPGQTPAQMDADVETALSCGLDQLCLYSLVLTPGTGWGNDPAMVAAMRTPQDACEQWLRLRARLVAEGYVQTTLTNFEREDVTRSPKRFRYEVAGFSVERVDALGFGPMGLTTVLNFDEGRGLKLMRRKDVRARPWSADDLMYRYDSTGLARLFVTRSLAKLRLDGALYQRLFGRSLDEDFAALPTLVAKGLVGREGADVVLTPEGMFFADAVVSLLALGAPPGGAGLRTMDLLKEPTQPGEYISMG